MEKTKVKFISKSEFWSLVGLLSMASTATKNMLEIEKAALLITGEDKWGHTSDSIWSSDTMIPLEEAQRLTKVLNIKVKS